MFDLGKSELQVSFFRIRANTIDRTLTLREDNIVFLISKEGGGHNFMNILLIFAYRFTLL